MKGKRLGLFLCLLSASFVVGAIVAMMVACGTGRRRGGQSRSAKGGDGLQEQYFAV